MIRSASELSARSVKKPVGRVISRPVSVTCTAASCGASLPARSTASTDSINVRAADAGRNGAPMVAAARTEARRWATWSTAAPPREWPTSRDGAASRWSSHLAALSRSARFSENNNEEKSMRRQAMPCRARVLEIRNAAGTLRLQVKQWANSATGTFAARKSSGDRPATSPGRSTVPVMVSGAGPATGSEAGRGI